MSGHTTAASRCTSSPPASRSKMPLPNASTAELRDECLTETWFVSLPDARATIETWRNDYNQVRPHSSLADRTPHEFILALKDSSMSPFYPKNQT